MKKSLYVITHKELDQKIPKGRKIMLVGAKNKVVPQGYYTDYSKDKDNISEKNANYCELTGFYYFCKHDDAQVLGLEHYRRFFVTNKMHVFRYHFLSEKKIDKILTTYDVILPQKGHLPISIYEQYCNDHYGEDMDKVRQLIEHTCPEYLNSFDKVMAEKDLFFYNMIIGKANIIKDYAKWLFDIEQQLENILDISNRDNYQKRVYGFISERLLNVYFVKHNEFKIKEMPVLFYKYKSAFVDQFARLGRLIKKFFVKVFKRGK